MESPEGLRLGRFYCQERLGAAGPLETWRARLYGLAGLDRPFSIKRLRPDADPRSVSRFLDAARLASGVEDRRLARIVEVSEGSGQGPFVAAEFVHGVDLRQLLDAARSVGMAAVPPDATAFVGARIAEALAVAHGARQPIAHGGLGPGNVIVTARGEVRLLDVATAGALRHGNAPATAHLRHTAPEVLAGAPPTPVADLYALGTLLYEMVSGARAFAARDVDELRAAMRTPPSATTAPDGLRGIIDELLAFEPSARSHAAGDVAARLDALLPPRSPFADAGRNLVELASVARRRALAMRPEPAGETITIVAEPSQSRPEPPPGSPRPAAVAVSASGRTAEAPPFAPSPSADMPEAPPAPAEPGLVATAVAAPTVVGPPAGAAAPAVAATPSVAAAPAVAAPVVAAAITGDEPSAAGHVFAAESTHADPFPAESTHTDGEQVVEEHEIELVYEPPPLPGQKPPPPPLRADGTRTSVPVPLPDEAPHPTMPPMESGPSTAARSQPAPLAARPAGGAPSTRFGAAVAGSDAARIAARVSLVRSTAGTARVEAPPIARRLFVVLALVLVGGGTATGLYLGRDVIGPGASGARHATASGPVVSRPAPSAAPGHGRSGGTPHLEGPGDAPAVPRTAAAGRIVLRSKPVTARVWMDGEEKGDTPIDLPATADRARVVLIAAGHGIWRKVVAPGETLDVDLTSIPAPQGGPAGLKVRCRTEGKFPVLVDGKETGLLCPTERIGVEPGDHEVSILVPADDKPHNQTDTFEESGSSKRVYFRY